MKIRPLLLLTACLSLAACDPVTMGLVTAGGGMAVNHQMSSTATRTFSDGAEPVHGAVLAALQRMSIEVTHTEHRGDVVVIDGKAGSRHVVLQVEPVTRTSTLLQVAVHQDLLTLDGATGREIVAQTELALSQHAGSVSGEAVATARTAGAGSSAAGGTGAAGTAGSGAGGRVTEVASGRTTYYGSEAPAAARVAKASRPRSRPGTAAGPVAGPAAGNGTGTSGTASNPAGGNAAGAQATPAAGSDAAGAGRSMAQSRRSTGSNLAVAAAP